MTQHITMNMTALTGALGSACGLMASATAGIVLACVGGAVIDFGMQATNQYMEKKSVDFSEIDYGKVLNTGLQTGLGTAVPQFGNAMYNGVEAFGTALMWGEASTFITIADVIYTNISKSRPDRKEQRRAFLYGAIVNK